ncbi:MAG: integrase core domain-containing protein, partial [Rubripirellula sp.]|nr:integrase core domain-containing protein [Rubripirellula sp.]
RSKQVRPSRVSTTDGTSPIFETRVEAKVLIERWRVNYSTVRPHSTLDCHSPAPETVQPHKPASATLQQRCAAGESLINSLA